MTNLDIFMQPKLSRNSSHGDFETSFKTVLTSFSKWKLSVAFQLPINDAEQFVFQRKAMHPTCVWANLKLFTNKMQYFCGWFLMIFINQIFALCSEKGFVIMKLWMLFPTKIHLWDSKRNFTIMLHSYFIALSNDFVCVSKS